MKDSSPDLYVYGFSEPGLPPRLRIRGRRLRTLSGPAAAAVVEPRREREPVTPDALREQHDIVAALLARFRAVIPARFGSMVTEARLRELLEGRDGVLPAALDRVKGRVQMTVRVFGPADVARPLDERGRGGAAFLEARRARLRHLPPEAAAIRDLLSPLATDERAEAGQGPIRLTVFHLVRARDVDRYRKRAAALQSRMMPLAVTVSGPWPAFAFSPELLR